MRRLVVCGLSETIATFPPTSMFTSVDLPTFGRPTTATKPLLRPFWTGSSVNSEVLPSEGVGQYLFERVAAEPRSLFNHHHLAAELAQHLAAGPAGEARRGVGAEDR